MCYCELETEQSTEENNQTDVMGVVGLFVIRICISYHWTQKKINTDSCFPDLVLDFIIFFLSLFFLFVIDLALGHIEGIRTFSLFTYVFLIFVVIKGD